MIKFDFTVSDLDAELIFSCLRDKEVQFRLDALDAEKFTEPERNWFRGESEYINKLMTKMANSYVRT